VATSTDGEHWTISLGDLVPTTVCRHIIKADCMFYLADSTGLYQPGSNSGSGSGKTRESEHCTRVKRVEQVHVDTPNDHEYPMFSSAKSVSKRFSVDKDQTIACNCGNPNYSRGSESANHTNTLIFYAKCN
jgi:hypothetical protein